MNATQRSQNETPAPSAREVARITGQANIRLPEITPGPGSHNWRHLCTCVARSLLKLLKLCNPKLLELAYPASPIPSLGKHEKALGHILSSFRLLTDGGASPHGPVSCGMTSLLGLLSMAVVSVYVT